MDFTVVFEPILTTNAVLTVGAISNGGPLLSSLMGDFVLLAQEGAPAGAPGEAAPSFLNPLTLVAGFFFLFYFIVIAPERRKKAEEAKMMSSLKKNDRVITIGGIHGVVASVSDASDVVTLRLDESGNTRIKVNRSAIGSIVNPKDKESSSNSKDKGANDKDFKDKLEEAKT